MKKVQPDISIIIVNYKSWAHLDACLTSLNKIKTSSFSFEVIVIDNCSNDGQIEGFIKTYKSIHFFKNSGNNGFANACNLGAKMAKGTYFMFLNPDTVVTEEVLPALLEIARKEPGYKLLSCNKRNNAGGFEKADKPFPSFLNLFGLSRALIKKLHQQKYKVSQNKELALLNPFWLSGSLVFMSSDWFDVIKGWDEDFWMYYEDVDLSKRTADLGAKIGLITTVSILHNHGGSSRINPITSAMTKAEVISSRHVYISKHFKGAQKWAAHCILIMFALLEKFVFALIGLFVVFIPKMRVHVFLFVNLLKYYLHVLFKNTWLSQRALKIKKRNAS